MQRLHTLLDFHALCGLLCIYYGFHISEFCVDSGAKVTVELNIGTPEQKVTCNECSCSEIVAKGEEFTTKACRMIYVTTECCETCSNYK